MIMVLSILLLVLVRFIARSNQQANKGECWTKAQLDEIEKAMDHCLKPNGAVLSKNQRAFWCDPKGPEVHTKLYTDCLTGKMKAKPPQWPQGIAHWQKGVTDGVKPQCKDPNWGKDKQGKDIPMTFYDNLYWLNGPINFDPNFKRSEWTEQCLTKAQLELQVGQYYCIMKDGKPMPNQANENNLALFRKCIAGKAASLSGYFKTEFDQLVKIAKLICYPNPKNDPKKEGLAKYIVKPENKLRNMLLPFDCYIDGQVLKFDPEPTGGFKPRCYKKGTGGGK